ncbi:MAG: hypothetical protein ABFR75_04590 [Acidobacteriota bacterium]
MRKFYTKNTFISTVLILFLALIQGCAPGNEERQLDLKVDEGTEKSWGNITRLMQETFRIDIDTINVVADYYPESYYVDCTAEVTFQMLAGQNKAVIHLDPAIRDKNVVQSIELNDESLNINDTSDVMILSFENTEQQALEFRRDLSPGITHILKISYRLNLTDDYYLFNSKVSDLYGRGNEEVFPTIDALHELATHTITFRIHSNIKFRCIGSGLVTETNNTTIQEWVLDTERKVSSHTVMFLVIPEADTIFEERIIDGVNVRIVAFNTNSQINEAFTRLESWLPELRVNLGPFPMPQGLSIFLMNDGGGMEYFGGTISSLWALKHEVFHMYFACSVVNKTYRDSWLDEAINEWYEGAWGSGLDPIDPNYESNIVSGRSPIATGFDYRAYDEGSRILEAVSIKIGGRINMTGFLSYLVANYSFKPFTTLQFLDYLEDYSGVNMREEFQKWVFSGEDISTSPSTLSDTLKRKHKVEIKPPPEILTKYNRRKK